MKTNLLLLLTLLFITGCGKKSEKDFIESAQKGYEENNMQQVITSYEALIEEYPESKSAPFALVEIGKLYQSNLVKNILPQESIRLAIEHFQKVADVYPQSEEAPMALFLIGFIQANELHDYEAATLTYKNFLAAFPEHDLYQSAKEELDNMGLKPEEILRRKIASEANE